MLLKALLLFLLFQFCTSRDSIRGNKEQLKDDGSVLVSKASNFELGFFSPRNSSFRYVGIWYSMSNETVVWVANRNNPINDTSGVLTINRYGSLVLYAHDMESNPVWYTNVSMSIQNVNTSTLTAQLLDTGNLVLFQDVKSEIFIWQSFDYPTDALIPGMKLGIDWKTRLERILTSWKSENDPGIGNFTLRLYPNQNATPQIFVNNATTHHWRSDPYPWPRFVSNLDGMYNFLINDTDLITRVKLLSSGLLQRLNWGNADHRWYVVWSAPIYRCDWYGQCGPNSKCNPDNINMFECECLPGYEPKFADKWSQNDGSDGCVRKRAGVSMCRNGEGFLNVPRVKDPDTSKAARWDTSMSAEDCKQECLRDCNCTACMSIEFEGSTDCLSWYGDLMDILVRTERGRDLYLRADQIELADYGKKSKGFLRRRGMLAIPILSVVLPLLLITIYTCWWLQQKKKNKDFAFLDELEETRRQPDLHFFHLSSITAATDNFSPVNLLGQGGFGSVYLGQFPNDQKIAIKRLSKTSGQGVEEFKNEVALIARLQHRNLVKLIGCCIEGEERILLLEYMPNKSLDSFIFDPAGRSFMDWEKRCEIIDGVARGILYLHQDSRLRIIHRDLKTSNVLLDAEMNPKISDFGMARIIHGDQLQDRTNKVVGTYGYLSPEYAVFGRFSTKSDVYSFGIILLEIVSGKKNNGSYWPEDCSTNLIGHIWQLWREDRALEIVDSSLESYRADQVLRCIQVGLLCVEEDSRDRPTMSAVVLMLSGEASLPSPQQPAFVFRRNPSNVADHPSLNDLSITREEGR